MFDATSLSRYGGRPHAKGRAANVRGVAGVILSVVAVGCGGGVSAPGVVAPVADPGAEAAVLQEATRVEQPTLVIFRWRISEEGVRLSGRGVARVEPPYRARLDLFLANGEPAAVAVLMEDDLRLPVTLPGGILPPAPLLWSSLGVFRVGPGAEVYAGDVTEDGGRLFRARLAGGEEVRYRFAGGVMRYAELLQGGSVVKRVELSQDGGSVPAEAVYRDMAAFRELVITRESVEHVASFPPDIWNP